MHNITPCMNFSERINDVIGAQGIKWNIELCDACYMLVPHTQECCVHPGLYHASDKMSCIKVYKSCAVCYCNIHGERVIESKLSRHIQSLFFIYCKQKPDEDLIIKQNYDFLYFIVSRHAVFKYKLYGKFGNYTGGREKQRFSKYDTHNPSYIYASVSYNTKAIHEHCGPGHKYLDNFIKSNVLKNNALIPLVNFKNTDWFEITQEASENIIEYIMEVKRRNKHPIISNGSDLEVFIHNICKCLEVGKSESVNICESCGCPKFTKKYCFECSATDKILNDYIHMFLTLPINVKNNNVHFVKQKGTFMLLQNFKEKFYTYMYLEHPKVKYRWTSDYSTFSKLGYTIVRAHLCKSCGRIAEAKCCSNYCPSNRLRKYIIKDISCKL